MKVGDTCYILVNNRIIQEVIIKSISGNLYTLKFVNENKTIRLPKHRLFTTMQDATMAIPNNKLSGKQERKWNKPPMLH